MKIFAIARNVIQQEFSERSTLIFFLVLPLIFTVIIGASLGGMYGGDPDEDPRIPIALVDQDTSDLSAEMLTTLENSSVVRPVVAALDSAQKQLDDQEIAALVVIPSGFEQQLLASQQAVVKIQQAGTSSGVAASQAVKTAVQQVSGKVAAAVVSAAEREKIQPFNSPSDRAAYFEESIRLARDEFANPVAEVETVTPNLPTQAEIATGFGQSSPGQLVTWVLITLLGAAESFVSERLGGTLRRLLITPTTRLTLLAGKVLGFLTMGIVQMSILIGFGAVALNVNWGRSPAALAMIVLSFALSAVSLGILISTFVRTRSQASGMVTLAGMLLSALGGAWWPLEITPQLYQTIVKALPTTWAMQGFGDVILRGQGPMAVLPETAILIGFSILFFAIAAFRLKFE